MTRVVVVVLVICAGLALYWQGGRNALQNERENRLQRAKDIGDAINDSYTDPDWRLRLRHRE